MLGFEQYYPELEFQPRRGAEHNWFVWCASGAWQVLDLEEHISYLTEHPDGWYTINFANAAAAHIQPGHPLWEKLAEVAKTYVVEVYRLTLQGGYVPWMGAANDLRAFDCIKLTLRQ